MRDANDPPAPDTARLSAIVAAVLGGAFTLAALALFGGHTAFSVAVGAGVAVLNLVALRAILSAMLAGAEAADRAAADPAVADPVADAEALGAKMAEEGDAAPAPDPAEAKARGRRGGAAWGVFAVAKIFVLFGGIWLLLAKGWVSAIPLVVGYGVLPLGITGSTVLASMRPPPRSRR